MGSGQVLAPGCTSTIYNICTVCNGAKIISTITGFPPGGIVQVTPQHDDHWLQEYGRFVLKKRVENPSILLDEIVKAWKTANPIIQ